MRVLSHPAGAPPRQRGHVHGETFAPLIREIAEIRLGLCTELGAFDTSDQVLQVAGAHLQILKRYDGDLYEELMGIAEGSGVDAAHLVVLNHYTDLRDLKPDAADTDGCSAVYCRTPEGPLLAQTWDMHGSAEPYVVMLHFPAEQSARAEAAGSMRPEAWVFSIVGCLGMTGQNALGLGITINNLKSTDARMGVLWPAVVRRALHAPDANAARDVILTTPLGSGHHYMMASKESAFGIETSGSEKTVVFSHDERGSASEQNHFVHTNHCLDAGIAKKSTVAATSTTIERYQKLTEGIDKVPIAGRDDLWRRLGDHSNFPRSVCTHLASVEHPHAMRTCGAIMMDVASPLVHAAPGCIGSARAHQFQFGQSLD